MQTGSNAVIYEAMDKGAMHLHAEGWKPNHDNFFNKYVVEAKTVKSSDAQGADAGQGICTTEDTAKRTGLKRVTDLTNPTMAKNFDTDGDGKGEIWIGAAGWGSTPTEQIKAKSYGYDATMKLKVMEEALAIAELDAAIEKKQNIVFFCYFPHYVFVRYKLVLLEEPEYDPKKWKIIKPDEDPQWLEKSYAPVAWPSAYMNVYYSASLETTHPSVAKLFSRANFSTEDTARMSLALAVNKEAPEGICQKMGGGECRNGEPLAALVESIIDLEGVWKIFGERSFEAMEAMKRGDADEVKLVGEYNCFVGIADCSFSVFSGEIFCIMGLSGSGKSTLIRHLNRLIEPTAGKITILGEDILNIDDRRLREMRSRKVAMVFQHMALLNHLNVRENVAFPLEIRGESKKYCWDTSRRCLELVNLAEHANRMPGGLSGGMRQRVGLARGIGL